MASGQECGRIAADVRDSFVLPARTLSRGIGANAIHAPNGSIAAAGGHP
jgi:hypothetical protein